MSGNILCKICSLMGTVVGMFIFREYTNVYRERLSCRGGCHTGYVRPQKLTNIKGLYNTVYKSFRGLCRTRIAAATEKSCPSNQQTT